MIVATLCILASLVARRRDASEAIAVRRFVVSIFGAMPDRLLNGRQRVLDAAVDLA